MPAVNPIWIKSNALFFISIIGLLAFRLFQWRDLTTPLVDYGLDDLLYLKLAKAFYWGYEYDSLAFVRRPGFPLWIAALNTIGLSFAAAQKAAYLSLIALSGVVANRLKIHKVLILGAVALTAYHPHAPAVLLRATPDGFYTLCIMACICFFGLSITSENGRARMIWSLSSGASAGAAFATRDEHILIVGFLLSVFIICILIKLKSGKSYIRHLPPVIAMTASIPLAISSINYYKFDQFALSEFSSDTFSATYQTALSVPREHYLKGVPISQAGLESLYQNSPSWLKLKPHLEARSERWASATSAFTGLPHEVGAGAFPWLLKEAANAVGAYASPQSADLFYAKLSEEIRTAQETGKIGRRSPVISQLDPDWSAWLPLAIRSLKSLATQTVHPGTIIVPYSAEDTSELKQLYNETLNRPLKEEERQIHSAKATGWMYQNQGRIRAFEIRGKNNETLYQLEAFTNRDDVYELRKGFSPQRDSGFDISVDFDGIDTLEAVAVFVTEREGDITIPIQNFLRRGSSKLREHGINYHLDELELKSSVNNTLVPPPSASERYTLGISLLAIASLGVAGYRIRNQQEWQSAAILWLGALSAWIVLRLFLCSLLDATAFPCTPRYLFSAALPLPWAIACLSALKSQAKS